jgi:outer membrane protein OmpA-like peptidoglycan-associated protein
MNENPNLKIQITGHTDSIGKPADNLVLSTGRAKAVINYLLFKGVRPDRLTSQGFGNTKPVADNKTEEGRALNRRTELTVVGN